MASIVYVTDFTTQGTDANAKTQSSAIIPPNQNQIISAVTTPSAATTNPISNNSTLVRVHNDGGGAVNIKFGSAPTAVINSDMRLAANQTEYFTVPMNSGLKVAAISATV